MPLARELLRQGVLPADVALFDVQVAYDILHAKGKIGAEDLAPSRLPFPNVFMEWEVEREEGPLTEEELAELRERFGVIDWVDTDRESTTIDRVGARLWEERDDGDVLVCISPYCIADDGYCVDFGVGYKVRLDEHGVPVQFAFVDLLPEGARQLREGINPDAVVDEFKASAKAATQAALMALGLINCRNVSTEVLGAIKMARSGTEKRRGIPQRKVRYHTIVLPGGGSVRYGSGSSAHHRATAWHKRPLMGKHVGTYWWGYQVRGDVEHGVVLSDYELGEAAGE
jgi:hypothetical protein